MPTHYNKLVRDHIPEVLAAKGLTCKTHQAQGHVLDQALKNKLVEEAQEVAATSDVASAAEELADVYEVLCAIMLQTNITWAQLKQVAAHKREQRGGFEHGIVLESVE